MILPHLTGKVAHEQTTSCKENGRIVAVIKAEGYDNS